MMKSWLRVASVGLVVSAMAIFASSAATGATLCQKKSGALFLRDACKKKETAVDPNTLIDSTALLGTLPSRVTTLEGSIGSLQSNVTTVQGSIASLQANALTKTSTGTVAGYATVDSDGTLVESYSSTGSAVSSSRAMIGDFNVSFGFTVGPDQAIVAVPRETFGHEICRVFLGSSPVTTVSVFCAQADAGSPAADVAFTIVVFN
jgi:hypothetical protein